MAPAGAQQQLQQLQQHGQQSFHVSSARLKSSLRPPRCPWNFAQAHLTGCESRRGPADFAVQRDTRSATSPKLRHTHATAAWVPAGAASYASLSSREVVVQPEAPADPDLQPLQLLQPLLLLCELQPLHWLCVMQPFPPEDPPGGGGGVGDGLLPAGGGVGDGLLPARVRQIFQPLRSLLWSLRQRIVAPATTATRGGEEPLHDPVNPSMVRRS